MENRSIGWEWISKIWVSIFLSCSPGLSLNFPLVAMGTKTLHSCLVQLLLPSLPPQLPSPAQTGLRLLRFSIHTLEASGEDTAQESLWRKGSMLDSEPKHSYSPQHRTGHEQSFLPKVLPSKMGVKKQQQRWETPDSIGHSSQFSRGGQPATPVHPHSPSHWHLTQRGCRCWGTKAFALALPESKAGKGCSETVLQQKEEKGDVSRVSFHASLL